jgi:alpha-D-xyloside xylohydrolase
MVERMTSLDQCQSDSGESAKLDYVEANFSAGHPGDTVAQVVVRDDDVLDKETIRTVLEIQKRLAENDTVAPTLATDRSTASVANAIATAAISHRHQNLSDPSIEQQIAAGLMFTITGNPKWTLDIGGFFVAGGEPWFLGGDYPDGHEDEGYRELYTRWFQFGTFLPMFRSHGTDTPREVWRFGEPGDRFYDTLVAFDSLRYRLLPYIYSLAGWETHRDYTMFRHLAFDFRDDEAVYGVANQFMCGPSLMVCPVTEPMYYGPDSTPLEGTAKAREVYLPDGTEWYDFWTGERYAGGRTILADAPIEKLPIYVRAGRILPMGPAVQHSGERPDAPWHLRVYPGRDGSFDIYEDAGDGYGYEDGDYAVTPIHWTDIGGELRLADRDGSFPELVTEREFRVRLVDEGVGVGPTADDDWTSITYDGTETNVTPEF